MIIKETVLKGVFEVFCKKFSDHRGEFIKTFHSEIFEKNGLRTDFKENFFSISKKNVIRGMHFQTGVDSHDKLIYVTSGKILDVVVNINSKSRDFGKYFVTEINSNNPRAIYISRDYAHGFLTLSEIATVIYSTTSVHNPKADFGIHWNSFGFEWPVKDPILSDRDKSFIQLDNFKEINLG